MKKKLLLIDKISLIVILICILTIICFIIYSSLFSSDVKLVESNNGGQVFNLETMKINVNTASEGELITVKYIGEKIAKEIIIYRNLNGPFKSTDELIKIYGIGKKTLEEIKKYLSVE